VYKDIFVFIEQKDNNLSKTSIEVLCKARELGDLHKEKIIAILIGEKNTGQEESLIHYGADIVLIIESPLLKEYTTEPYTKCICQIVNKYNPKILLYGATYIGNDLAARVSTRLNADLITDCTNLDIELETGFLTMTRPSNSGAQMITYVCENFYPQMATVKPGIMKVISIDKLRIGEIFSIDIDLNENDVPIKVYETLKLSNNTGNITEAKYLISGGRGAGGPEGFKLLKELAGLIGGEIATSRPNVDEGWIEKERQVGLSGKTVNPQLYLACGISGSIHHVIGMENSEMIIAINVDRNAPIFDMADVGIVGDLKSILPKLIDNIKNIK